MRLEKTGIGEADSTWGAKLNTVIDLIEESLTSMETIATTTGTVTLTTSNSVSDQSRKSAIKLTGALTGNLIIVVPNQNKHYMIWNATTNAFTVTVKTSAGTGIAVTQGTKQFVYCDATNVVDTFTLTSFGVTATSTELNYVAGVSSAIQTQLNGKLATSGGTDLAVADGGTGASTAANARTNLGAAAVGVVAGSARQTDQAVTATTRADTTTLGTSLNHTLSDTATTITAFNGVAGVTYSCRALGAGSITHHATNLIITQGSASLTTAAGMTFDVEMITSTTCRIKNVMKADGTAVVPTTAATQAEQETATSVLVPVTPGLQQYHPSAAKAWAKATFAGAVTVGYNVTSVTDNGVGDISFNFTVPFSSANYVAIGIIESGGAAYTASVQGQSTTACRMQCRDTAGNPIDATSIMFVAFGDQ